MRSPMRLDSFYDELKQIHKTYFPDLRFMQLMINYLSWHKLHYDSDGFYCEEAETMKRMHEYVEWCMNWGEE